MRTGPHQKLIGCDTFIHDPRLTVVTEERGDSARKPKIPFVCRQEGLRSISLLQLIEEQNWRFG